MEQGKSNLIFEDETIDEMFDGSLRVIQKKNGYRFSLDAVLLANFVPAFKDCSILDIGTGSGIIPLILSRKTPAGKITGVEIQEDLAEMARRNAGINGLENKIVILREDFRKLKNYFSASSFDLIVSNPPFYQVNSGRINPHPQKATARHELMGSLSDLIKISHYLIKPSGRVIYIYPAARLADIIFNLRAKSLEPKILRMVHSRIDSPAKLALIESSKGGKSELKVHRPLFVYQKDGKHTEEVNGFYSFPGP